ncbi:MAG: gliding motility-associated C-terminal domain-containing protein [Bacteroidota bacterium]
MRNVVPFLFLLLSVCAWQPLQAQYVTTVAGEVEVIGQDDGEALNGATFNNPHGITMDGNGIIYIADRWNHKIRRFDPKTEQVTTYAGTGQIGKDDGPALSASFYEPWGIYADSIGTVYVADTKNHLVRKIDTSGMVSTIAGSGLWGVLDGPASVAKFYEPSGILADRFGNIYVCDHLGHTVRKITTNGIVTTLAGAGLTEGYADGPGNVARFNRPFDMDWDHEGNIIMTDEWNHRIRRIALNGTTTTVAGSGSIGDLNGPADQASFNYPWDVCSDANGVLYVMDGFNYIIRKIENGEVQAFVGESRIQGAQDGVGDQASFNGATAMVFDPVSGDIYVADAYNQLIRKVSTDSNLQLSAENLQNGDTVCVGFTTTFFAAPDIFQLYDFYVNGTSVQVSTVDNYSQSFLQPGEVEVEVIGTDENNGQLTSNTIRFYVAPFPTATYTLTDQRQDLNGLTVEFTGTEYPGGQYHWEFGDSLAGANNFATGRIVTHTYTEYGNYPVSLSIASPGGCADTLLDAPGIEFKEQENLLFIPTAFTPNGDGVNDILFLRGKNIVEMEFMVFNEWGEMIFRTVEPSEGWDGTRKNREVNPDTYVYLAKVKTTDGVVHTLHGKTTLIR